MLNITDNFDENYQAGRVSVERVEENGRVYYSIRQKRWSELTGDAVDDIEIRMSRADLVNKLTEFDASTAELENQIAQIQYNIRENQRRKSELASLQKIMDSADEAAKGK